MKNTVSIFLLSAALALTPVSGFSAKNCAIIDYTLKRQITQSSLRDAQTPSSGAADSSAPTASKYIDLYKEELAKSDIECHEMNAKDPYTLIMNSSIILSIARDGDKITGIDITAQGDGSARSGEVITDVLISSVRAYSSIERDKLAAQLIDMISQTKGEEYVPGLKIDLSWTSESIEMQLSPSSNGAAELITPSATAAPTSIAELIDYCAGLLPDGWKQTSYQSANEQYTDVLLNIYAASSDSNALLDCARTLLIGYWQQVKAGALPSGRLSLVFYSSDMTPLLSLGISRKDALASAVFNDSSTTQQVIAELDRLSKQSDALLVRHYD